MLKYSGKGPRYQKCSLCDSRIRVSVRRPAQVSAQLPKTVTEWLSKIGAKGGKATSPAKAKAVRANGKLGGRPKSSKTKVKP